MSVHLPWRMVPVGPEVSTSLTADEAAALRELACDRKVLEIGSAYGYSAIMMSLGGATSVDAVDPHGVLDDSERVMRDNLAVYGIRNVNMRLFRSEEAPSRLEPGSYDLVFIDGDHGYDSITADIRVAEEMLTPDGVLAAHDFDEDCCADIRRALDEKFPDGPDRVVGTLYVRGMRVRPLVTVVTSTWRRPDTLFTHAVDSVSRQDYPAIEHVVVIDGDDPDVAGKLLAAGYTYENSRRRVVSLGRNWSSFSGDGGFGATARLVGSWMGAGEYIAYLDDDNTWDAHHISSLVRAIEEDDGVDFAISGFDVDGRVTGGQPTVGNVDTSGILHRAIVLKQAGGGTSLTGTAGTGR